MNLGARRWPELAGDPPAVLVLPLGATEQHGPHLPLATDTLIATAVAMAATAHRSDVVVAPALPFGSSGEHAGFPGTLSLGQAAVELAVLELVRSAAAFELVVLVSWHGGNTEPVARAVEHLRGEGRPIVCWSPSVRGDAHAGRLETSLMLAIAPELVTAERPVGVADPLPVLLPALREFGVRAVAPNGVLGDARGASAQEGRDLLSELAADLEAAFDAAQAPA